MWRCSSVLTPSLRIPRWFILEYPCSHYVIDLVGAKNMTSPSALTEKKSLQAKAAEVFGSQKAGEAWFASEVLGLNHARPADLVRTRAGRKLVHDFLVRLDYGVYQ